MGRVSTKAVWGAALALWVMIPAATAQASQGRGKLDRVLEQSTDGSQRVIIRYRPGARDRVKGKLQKQGRGPSEHKLISGFAAFLDRREIAALASDPDVLSVSADVAVTASTSKKRANGTNADTSLIGEFESSGILKRTLGLQGWFTGASVTVAVIDSGLQSTGDFSGRIVGFYDFSWGRGGIATVPTDEYGHGTHVAGLIGSSGVSSNGKYAGVAPGVKLLALKVLDKKGSGKTSDVISALEFAVANKDRFGIRVVNLSLGHPVYEPAATDPLVQAVEAAVRSGLIVVTAAGNFGTNPHTGSAGYGGIASPGNAPSAITVGASNTAGTAVRTDDRVASYSSRGPSWYDGIAKPDIVAPGTGLVSNAAAGSTLLLNYPSLGVTEGLSTYLRLNGSSMGTAVVSGLVAVMLEANTYGAYSRWYEAQSLLWKKDRTQYTGAPPLTANAVKALLQYSATSLKNADGVRYDTLTQGAGEVNGLGAVTLSYSTDTTKAAGSFWMTSTQPASTNFGGVEEVWSQAVVWGTRLVSGSSLIEFNQPAWQDNIVWGTGELDNIVWGTTSAGENIVWGTNYGENIVWGTSILADVSWYGNTTFGQNIVWGATTWAENIVWGTNLLGFYDGENIVWGTTFDGSDNIVWGTLDADNIVWGTSANKVTVLGASLGGEL